MTRALAELVREAGVELLFDQKLVQSLTAKPVRGRMSPGAALSALLAGSGIGYRITSDGAFVLFPIPLHQALPPNDGAIAEILVVGSRTQNVDIRRSENDIQPYKIASQHDIETAQRDNVDQFLRSREPSNVQIRAPSQDPAQIGSTRSAIDLRGFGSQQTLVLVDGRRMPSLPSTQGEFDQTDLNGIPLGAIERIEVLTSTAGGIYGPSAIGGVVNVVLRREYRGADLNIISGVTTRGDAAQVRVEGRIGFTPDHGDTDVMLSAAYATSDPLLAGQRDFLRRSRAQAYANDPEGFAARRPAINGILVSSLGGPLTLDPQYGGGSLGSPFTYLPTHFAGTAAQSTAILIANAGKLDPSLPEDGNGTGRSLVSTPMVVSGIFSIRRRFGERIEVYADGLYSLNEGKTEGGAGNIYQAPSNASENPFSQSILLLPPAPGFDSSVVTRTETGRFTAGLIASLPWSWKATADYAIGQALVDVNLIDPEPTAAYGASIFTGTAAAGLPLVNPLGIWDAFLAAGAAYRGLNTIRFSLTNRFTDASLRLAGPVIQLPGGPLTLTLVGETRREHIPASKAVLNIMGQTGDIPLPLRSKRVNSAYAELRAPIVPVDAGFFLWRGLEIQLAGRFDHTAITLPDNALAGSPSNDRLITLSHDAEVFTVGARTFPLPGLMLRASLATGELPPTISQLHAQARSVNSAGLNDPKRGDQPIGVGGAYNLLTDGSHRVKPEQGRTVTIGAVINPSGRNGPRLSLDYSRTTTDREIRVFPLTAAQLVAAEATYPDRVQRGPLSPADAALGYTAGPILVLDTGAINAGGTVVEALDVKFDWALPAGRLGDFRIHGSGTWQPTYLRRAALGHPASDRVGFADGPLALRGNLGVEWTRGPLSVDFDGQYLDGYRVINADDVSGANPDLLAFQGASRIPHQIYFDVSARRRFEMRVAGRLSVLEIRLGVINVFDEDPPIITDPSQLGFSPYGDPRGRRIELAISTQF